MAVPAVTAHYATPGILENMLQALEGMGKGPQTVVPADLKACDEFHMGGAPAAAHLLAQMDFLNTDRVLDVGCGIGGTARAIACNYKVSSVVGVDLTQEYVEAGTAINAWPGIQSALAGASIELHTASATALPFADASFDKLTMVACIYICVCLYIYVCTYIYIYT